MSFFCRLSRRHYWCTPHRLADNQLVQVCYECGAERVARELHDEILTERVNHSVAAAKAGLASLSRQRLADEAKSVMGERPIAVGQSIIGKFTLVK